MKKIIQKQLSLLTAIIMLLCVLPVYAAAPTAGNSQCKSAVTGFTKGSENAVNPFDAANLDEALNIEGGNLHFISEGDYPWAVEEDWAKSTNEGVPDSESRISTVVTAAEGDFLRFDFQSWGEGWDEEEAYDYLKLEIDNEQNGVNWFYNYEWETYMMPLVAGEHTISWTFLKDDGFDEPDDHALLDNVYAGQPIMPAEIIAEPITVNVGLHAAACWAVLPEFTFDKTVTFDTADAGIASVNENGIVTGVAEGTTQLIITSTADSGVQGFADITVTGAIEATQLNGYIGINHNGSPVGTWCEFGSYDPSIIETYTEMGTLFAAAYAGGNVYGFLGVPDEFIFYDQNTWSGAPDSRFFIMNAETHEVTYPGYDCHKLIYAMAYDHANGIMYAVARENGYSNLYKVNLAIGTLEFVTHLKTHGKKIMTFAIDSEGNAYGINRANPNNGTVSELWSINLADGEITSVGDTGIMLKWAQSMTWDHNTNQLFLAQYYDAENNGLYIIDPATAEASPCGRISSGAEIVGLWIANDMPVAEITVPKFDIKFKDGFTGEIIPGGYTVEGGTMLDTADFPEPPVHEGHDFVCWTYDGLPVYGNKTIVAKYNDPYKTGYYFETNPKWEGWTWEDKDGDGFNWQWIFDDGSSFWTYIIPEGQGMMNSESYINDVGALTPDNWLISPKIAVPAYGNISFMFIGQDANYYNEPIGVYVSADGGENWSDELGYFVASDAIQTVSVDISAYTGQTVLIAFRHYDVTDEFSVNFDAVEISEGEPPEPSVNPGDYDCDGDVDTEDALLTLRAAMELITPSEQSLLNADMDGDGKLTAADALTILRIAMGLA